MRAVWDQSRPPFLKARHTLLRPCLGQGASRRARVGRVRSLAFFSILHGALLLFETYGPCVILACHLFFHTLLSMLLAETIKRDALALGFDAVGISRIAKSSQPSAISHRPDSSLSDPAPPLSHHLFSRLVEWLQRGYHGTMAWMTRDPARRSDPQLVLPGCRSMISVGMNYYTNHRANEQPGMGRIARYAWGKDYHTEMSRRLAQLEEKIAALAPGVTTKAYVDTGPIMEKAWAQQAGLGWIGKHSNLVSTECGSWLLLGEILTTLDLTPDEPATDLCGSCTLCIQACPTGAIVEPYVVDARLCISYLTIELRGGREIISDELASQMGNHIFGCDDCL
ncbi:MAG: tRNA epoxyqueuosine(34) reductase QueG, partial [Nitrospiraceae bacterium]